MPYGTLMATGAIFSGISSMLLPPREYLGYGHHTEAGANARSQMAGKAQ